MRLLYLTADPGVPVLGHKGASVHVRELATALSHLGAEVAIASPRTEPAGDSLDAPIDLDLRAELAALGEAVLDVARLFGAEAIYERYSLFSAAGVEAAATLGIPHVLEVNAPLRAEASRFRKLPHPVLAEEIERAVFRSTSSILVVSPALRSWLEAEGVAPERVEVVPNAVAPERFGPRHERSDGAFVTGFCGSLKAWHGVEALLEACAVAFAEEPSLRLEVVGSGPLENLVREARLPADRLVVHGALPHAEAIERLRGWSAGVAPYLPLDGFYFSPLKVFEYMAAGLCPVASALGEIPALLGEGERGVLVRAGDASGLATALVELARNRGWASELGSRARAHVLETYSWERNARAVLDALGVLPGELAA
ncbi:MAG: glycosyltransferase family 4 protein [Actinobacteria bacterium]|nr:MAG: glycosyltransferase family 4 protein [Actinomycetota bacterium]